MPKLMEDSSNFDQKWPKKEQTQGFKHQIPSRSIFIQKETRSIGT